MEAAGHSVISRGVGIVEVGVKLILGMLASCIEVFTQVLSQLLSQLLASVPGMRAEDGPSTWVPVMYMGDLAGVPAPSFSLA